VGKQDEEWNSKMDELKGSYEDRLQECSKNSVTRLMNLTSYTFFNA